MDRANETATRFVLQSVNEEVGQVVVEHFIISSVRVRFQPGFPTFVVSGRLAIWFRKAKEGSLHKAAIAPVTSSEEHQHRE